MKEKIFCKVCNTQTKYVADNFTLHHLKKEHNICNMKEYYDLHVKKDDEGICGECGKETKFYSYTRGYAGHCSQKCYRKSDECSKAISSAFKDRDMEKVMEKRRKTNLEKYGVESYVSTNEYKKSRKETCLEKYGVEHNFQTEDCKKKREDGLKKEGVNEKRKAWWTDENKKKVRETLLKTLDEKHGVQNPMLVSGAYDKMRKTNEVNGRWLSIDDMDEYSFYCLLVLRETRKHEDKLFDDWSGYCYYSDKLLVGHDEYKKKHPNKNISANLLQPTIDHKTSIKYGFQNGISPDVIGNISNLCICSRSTNSSKNQLTEEQYYDRQKSKG